MTRQQRLRDLLSAIETWRHESGRDRLRARRNAMAMLAEFKAYHLIPERLAFEASVRANKQRGRRAA